MSRLHLTFQCGKSQLAGTLDTAPGTTGLLIVSGGNELRSGAFSGQAQFAARIAKAGFPVFRFDRRGIGDSEGDNRGFRKSAKDIRAATEAFKAIAPHVDRVMAMGNCDAASALMLMQGEGFDGLILSNPWTFDDDGESDDGQATEDSANDLPPEAIRARYIEKLRNPSEIKRLLSGGVDLRKLLHGLFASLRGKSEESGLAQDIRQGLAAYNGAATILLAMQDRTAQAFASHWDMKDSRIAKCKNATHAYVEAEARQWLEAQTLKCLRG